MSRTSSELKRERRLRNAKLSARKTRSLRRIRRANVKLPKLSVPLLKHLLSRSLRQSSRLKR